MKILQIAALAVILTALLLRLAPLPDWAVRLNGIVMLAGTAALVFSSVRLALK